MGNLREQLVTQIKGKLNKPNTYRFVTDEKPVGRIERPLIRVAQKRFRPLPEAPRGGSQVEFNIRVTSPLTDLAAAETALTDQVGDITAALEQIPGVRWTDAEKILDPDLDLLAYDITATAVTRKD